MMVYGKVSRFAIHVLLCTCCSSALLARRYCSEGGFWNPVIDFSGCTLNSPDAQPFLILTFDLIPFTDILAAQDQFSQQVGCAVQTIANKHKFDFSLFYLHVVYKYLISEMN